MINKFNTKILYAPWNEWVLLKVESKMILPKYDYVLCTRYRGDYSNGEWITAQCNELTQSHMGKVVGWAYPEHIDEDWSFV